MTSSWHPKHRSKISQWQLYSKQKTKTKKFMKHKFPDRFSGRPLLDSPVRWCFEPSQPQRIISGLKTNSVSLSVVSQFQDTTDALPCHTSIFLYACESWTLTAELQRKIQAKEMRCYSKILHISYKDHVPDEEIRAKIQQAIGPHKDLLTITERRKLQWYGRVSRSSGLAKTIM